MYNTIKLEKSLYSITGKNFTQALTALDPDEAYENTELKGLDAFERQLKRFDIHVSGAKSDRVEKFFVSAESAVLFPEFIRRSIKKGMDEASITGTVCAAVSYTDAADFRGITMAKSGDSDICAEGAQLPETAVRLSSSAKALTKFARKLSCSYESIRKQRLDTFAVILRSLGASVAREIDRSCANALMEGLTATEISGSAVTYADLAKFWSNMNENNMDVMVCAPEVIANILALDEMKYCVSEFMSNGRVKTPYGVTLVKSSVVSSKYIIGIDSSCACEMILGTDVIVDYDKLISAQCEEIACSVMVGFSRIDDEAVKVLDTKLA